MNLSATTSIQPQLPFAQASVLYQNALTAIEFPPNAMVELKLAVTQALADVDKAVELLTPYVDSADRFVGPNAKQSVTAAKMGASSLAMALSRLDNPGDDTTYLPTFDASVAMAKDMIQSADNALWQEIAG